MKKPRPTEGEIWISGVNPVREALRAEGLQPLELLLARSDPRGQELEQLAKMRGVRVTRADRERLIATAGHSHHQGAGLLISEFPYTPLESLLEKQLMERDPLFVLDSIQDPQNLGAILRSACFLGAKGVIIPRDRAAGITSAVIRIAAGATSYVPVVRVTNVTRALQELKDSGYWAAGLEMEGSISLYDADLTLPLCLVVGNEQKGIRPLVRSECDLLVRIPSAGPLESLNAASAATVALAEAQRQRFKAAK